MNDYHAVETLCLLKMQDIRREAAMAALAAQVGRHSRHGYRAQLARSLRTFAGRIDPTFEPRLTALPG